MSSTETLQSQSTDGRFSIDVMVKNVEEISHAINDIHSEVVDSRAVVKQTLNSYTQTAAQITELSSAATTIVKVIGLIEGVASKINMLGLNASIEAARAGESGKGFAVVAGEVKKLANQTSSATQTVRASIDAVTNTCTQVSQSLDQLRNAIGELADSSDAIENGTDIQNQMLDKIHGEALKLAQHFKEQNSLRLENAALNVVQLIVRNLYERTADVRWWATDPSLVRLLETPQTQVTMWIWWNTHGNG